VCAMKIEIFLKGNKMKTTSILAILVLAMGPVVWSGQATSPGSIVAWGANDFGQATPPSSNDFVAIAAGGRHGLALKSDGSIVGWGSNGNGQSTPPAGNDFVVIAAGDYHSLALKSDGTIVGWGLNNSGQANPRAGNDFVNIAAGSFHSLALKSDGSVVGWGNDNYGQASPPAGNDFVAIATGNIHSLALKSDGSIVGWGYNGDGRATPPAGNDFVAIAAGSEHSLALKSYGRIVGWGDNRYGQASPPAGNDFVAIAAGAWHSLALRADGSIVGWGHDHDGQASPPAGNDFVAIAAGASHSLAIKVAASGGLNNDWFVSGDNMYSIPTGNVGIGTTNPSEKLEVEGYNPRILIDATSGNPELNLRAPGKITWAMYQDASTGDLRLYQEGDKITFQNSTGNLGIGTTTPSQLLEVQGSNPRILINATASNPEVNLRGPGKTEWAVYQDIFSATGDLRFYQAGDKVTFQNGTGNVGIGKINPGNKLEVDSLTPGTSGLRFTQLTNASTPGPAGAKVLSVNQSGDVILVADNTGGGGADDDWRWSSGSDVTGVIYHTGNVGIGTTSPSEKLDVAGAANLNKGISAGIALMVNGSEALWYNGTYFSWGFGGTANFFADGIGIGTASPGARLDVVSATSPAILLRGPSFGTGTIGFYKGSDWMGQIGYGDVCGSGLTGLDEALGICSYTGTATIGTVGKTTLIVKGTGNVGIGTNNPAFTLHVNGSAGKPGGGSWSSPSDIRLKVIKGNYGRGLSEIVQLQPVRYSYKQDNQMGLPLDKEYVGVTAQDVKHVIPEAVSENEKGYLMVDNDPIIWAMVNAIKELKGENQELKAQNQEMKQRLEALERKMGQDKSAIVMEVQ